MNSRNSSIAEAAAFPHALTEYLRDAVRLEITSAPGPWRPGDSMLEDALKMATVFPQRHSASREFVAAHLLDREWIHIRLAEAVGMMESGKDLTGEIEHYTWPLELLPAVNWWQSLADHCLVGPEVDGCDRPDPNFAKQGEILSSLLGDVLAAYVKAHKESWAYTEDWGEVGPGMMEFLNCYGLYTRAVEAFVIEVFPDVNRELLLNPELGVRS